MKKYSIGEIRVFVGAVKNPYQTSGLIGQERVNALTAYKHGGPIERYSFWAAPACGGAVQLLGPEQIDWNTSGI
jgi:hypothetical protein